MSKQPKTVQIKESSFSSQSLQALSRTGGGGILTMMNMQEKKTIFQMEKIHSPNGLKLSDIRPLFNHAKLLFRGSDCYKGEVDESCKLEKNGKITQIMKKVLCEIAPGSQSDISSSILAVARVMKTWEWLEVIVIMLAAFSVKLGDFKLMEKMYKDDALAASLAILKDVENSDYVKLIDTLTTVIDVMIKVTEKVVRFSHCFKNSKSVLSDDPQVAVVLAIFPVTACLFIKSTITAITCVSMTSSSSATSQLSKCSEILKELLKDIEEKTRFVDKKRVEDAYKKLKEDFEENVTVDISMTIKGLICPNDDDGKLYCGREKKEVDFSHLQQNTVLLLITKKKRNSADLDMLEKMYPLITKRNCKIVWVEVTEEFSSSTITKTETETETKTKTKTKTSKRRSWYCVSERTTISQEAIMFFKKDLHFNGSPTLVCMDTKEKFSPMNVLHLVKIWGEKACPFNKTIATELWDKNSFLTLDFLVDNVAEYVPKWQEEKVKEKYMVVYGGDVEGSWISSFKKAIEGFRKETKTTCECIYVGQSSMESKKNSSSTGNAFGCVMEEKKMRVFWTRLESIMYTHMELELEKDTDMMGKIKKIISYDKSKSSWGVIFKGNKLVQVLSGKTVLQVFQGESWEKIEKGGIEKAIKFKIDNGEQPNHPDIRFAFPCDGGKVPLTMDCPHCDEEMVAITIFVCCKDRKYPGIPDCIYPLEPITDKVGEDDDDEEEDEDKDEDDEKEDEEKNDGDGDCDGDGDGDNENGDKNDEDEDEEKTDEDEKEDEDGDGDEDGDETVIIDPKKGPKPGTSKKVTKTQTSSSLSISAHLKESKKTVSSS